MTYRNVSTVKAQIPLCRLPRPEKFRGSRRSGIWAKGVGDVTGLSRTCRGRHGEFGIVEFGLQQASAFAEKPRVAPHHTGNIRNIYNFLNL